MLESKKLHELKKIGQAVEVTLQVGKAGVTDALVSELYTQLEDHELVKVRLLKGEVEEGAEGLAKRAGAELVEVRGKTALFYKA